MAEQRDGLAPPPEPPHGGSGGAERRRAVEQLVRDHHAELYRYAFRLTGTQADAEDIAQQTFLIAYAKLEQLRDGSKARGWLYAIARSCFLKSRRKVGPVPASVVSIDLDGFPTTGDSGEPFDQEHLSSALAQLPDETRVILNMFYFEQASYREIAEALEIRLGTVMSRLSRAKDRLRKLLLGNEAEEVQLTPLAESRSEFRERGA